MRYSHHSNETRSTFIQSLLIENKEVNWIGIAAQLESRNFHCTCWLVCSTVRPVWLHFKSGSFQKGSYGAFNGRSSGTSKRRSSLYGMRLTLGTAVQESSWRLARTLTAQQLPNSTLHSVNSLLSRQHCITLDIARYRPKNGSFRSHHIYKSHDLRNAFMPVLILKLDAYLRSLGLYVWEKLWFCWT